VKLNLGCGPKRLEGWINADKAALFKPDQLVDLERFPWPWKDSSAEEVLLHHVLEHLGQTPDTFIGVMKELWRVCAPDARVRVYVPDPRHESFLGDPTHVRPVTVDTLALFSQSFNRRTMAEGSANTPLGVMHGIDFEVEEHEAVYDAHWRGRIDSGEITVAQAADASRQILNVILEHRIVLVARKGAR
jgi:predicted SAM-dependent methyltransferase